MNYNTLESIVRSAACKTLGARSDGFDELLITCDPNEDIDTEGINLGTSVELCFDLIMSPFTYFTSDVIFNISVNSDGLGDAHAFFGRSCYDPETAMKAAKHFLDREHSDGWYIEDEFDIDSGLHLMRSFDFKSEDESDLSNKIAECFTELCEAKTVDKLRSFIHYFED